MTADRLTRARALLVLVRQIDGWGHELIRPAVWEARELRIPDLENHLLGLNPVGKMRTALGALGLDPDPAGVLEAFIADQEGPCTSR